MAKQSDIVKITGLCKDIEYIRADLTEVKEDVKDVKKSLSDKYVTQVEFGPIKKIVYGIVALVLTAVVGALISLVVLK